MPECIALSPSSPWLELRSTERDWEEADPIVLGTMLSQMHLIRAFEETVFDLWAKGLGHGFRHLSPGQEGGAVGSILPLNANDGITGAHRGHHQFLAKALGHIALHGLDPHNVVTPEIQNLLQRTLAELLGLAQGFCHGRGGSMHLRWKEAGALGTNAVVGASVPPAAGAAWACKHSGTNSVVVAYFGDGAVNMGSVLETMNIAAAWKLPLCFFIENNGYAASTSVNEATAEPRLSVRGLGFKIPAWRVDGMDPLAVYLAMLEALGHMRAGRGPTVIEVETYNYIAPYSGTPFAYRPKEEEEAWRARDPLDRMAAEMQKRKLIDEAGIAGLREQACSAMRAAVTELTERAASDDSNKIRIRPALWPSADFRDVGVRGDLSELRECRTEEIATFKGRLEKRKFIDVIADVMARRMETDSRIVVLGEDIHKLNGGTNGATRGLKTRFPDRVLGTPICENTFAGLAGGIALDGRFRPVVEFMFPDFIWLAADQLFNQIGKSRHMFGGESPMPLVLRTKVAMGMGYGSQHSLDPAGIFVTAPGWRIVAPSTPFDYVGLMNSALACNDPVLVIEHLDFYAVTGDAPVDDLDYHLPFGKACIRRNGAELTILTYLSMVACSLEAAEQTGIDAEVIDLRWLDNASLDWQTIEASIRKTNHVLIVEQGARGTSYGSWLADEIQRRFFDWLDRPIRRVTGAEASPSISKVLERAAIAGLDEIVEGMLQATDEKHGKLAAV
ncbi:MAG: thiamine pyrophosphate-dependent enzyme [Candidatus Sulfotelmatobacter sp.]